MGSNKTYQQKGDRGRVLGESGEFRKLQRAIEKAQAIATKPFATSAAFTVSRRSTRCQVRSGRRRWRFSTPESFHAIEHRESYCEEAARHGECDGSHRPILRRHLPLGARQIVVEAVAQNYNTIPDGLIGRERRKAERCEDKRYSANV